MSGKQGITLTKRQLILILAAVLLLMTAAAVIGLNWSRWFFPLINTTESLQLIDSYAQDQLRFLISGKRTKSRFNVRYEDLKVLGYRSLVNEYYKNRHQGDGSSDA